MVRNIDHIYVRTAKDESSTSTVFSLSFVLILFYNTNETCKYTQSSYMLKGIQTFLCFDQFSNPYYHNTVIFKLYYRSFKVLSKNWLCFCFWISRKNQNLNLNIIPTLVIRSLFDTVFIYKWHWYVIATHFACLYHHIFSLAITISAKWSCTWREWKYNIFCSCYHRW